MVTTPPEDIVTTLVEASYVRPDGVFIVTVCEKVIPGQLVAKSVFSDDTE